MSDVKLWGKKFDPYSRMQMEDGLPEAGVEVTVRLNQQDTAAHQVERAGLKLHTRVGEIVVGHVANETDLKQIAELDCVQEVQLARPLYEDHYVSSEKEI